MEFQGISDLKKALSQPEASNFEAISKEEEIFGEMGQDKIKALKESISEVFGMISERQKLSLEVIGEAEKLKREIEQHIAANEKNEIGGVGADLERKDLRHKKMEIAELQLNERIACWKDIALLKREKREYERELTEKEGRMEALNKILEEN
jgi:nitrate/TMAO reductase-like tetraheme cytochrome c subunit